MGDWLNKKVKVSNPTALANFVASLRYDGYRSTPTRSPSSSPTLRTRCRGGRCNRKELLTKPIAKVRETLMQMARAYDASQVSIILGDTGRDGKLLDRKLSRAREWLL